MMDSIKAIIASGAYIARNWVEDFLTGKLVWVVLAIAWLWIFSVIAELFA